MNLCLTVRSGTQQTEQRLFTEEGIPKLLLQPGPHLGALIGLRFGFAGHLDHIAYLRGSDPTRFRLWVSLGVYRPIVGLAAEEITIGGWVPASGLVVTGHVVKYPPF